MCTEVSNQERDEEMGWPETDFCIKCDRGGKVLICSDSNCPIVVHEKCMGCPAKFDDRGNFYCPYCLYRQANEESRKAREDAMFKKQALSSFLDKEIIIGDKPVQPSMRKLPSKRADKSSPEEHMPSKRADKSSPEEHTGFLQSKCNNYSRENHCEPEVDDLQLDRDVEDRQEDGHLSEMPEREKKIRKKAKRVLAEKEPEVDNQQLDGDFEEHQEDGHPSEIPEREKKIRKKAKRMRAENEPEVDDQLLDRDVEDHQEDGHLREIPEREENIMNEAERKENETAGGAEAEQMRGKTRESAASFVNEEPESQLHLKAKRRDGTGASTSREFEAVSRRSNRITKENEIEDQPLNSDSKRSSRTASTARKVSRVTGETSAPDKLKKAEEYSTWLRNQFPNGRRKKLMWSQEEEEMLEEGVQKFSAVANKNIPWRKILEFGRRVFDQTRTPADLKDKWRTMCSRADKVQ